MKSGMWYFRTSVPDDLIAVNSPKEIYLSLHTKNKFTATSQAKYIKFYLSNYFNLLRASNQKFRRRKVEKTGNAMADLIASLVVGQTQITLKSSAENQGEVSKLIQSILASQPSHPAGEMTVVEAFKQYLTSAGFKQSTLDNRKYQTMYVEKLFGQTQMHSVNRNYAQTIRKNIFTLRNRKNSPISKGQATKLLYLIRGCFKWAVSEGICETNPFEGLMLKKVKASIPVSAYVHNELERLFDPAYYLQYNSDFEYWIAIISLFTGMRIGEIAQLETSDIRETTDGVAYISINEVSTHSRYVKSVKNTHSQRIVPVSDHLKRLGFLDYVKMIRDEGYWLLFPDIKVGTNGHIYTHIVSTWFTRYKAKRLEPVENRKVDFHSFRHNFVACLKNKKCNLADIQQLVGHRFGSITFDVYGEPTGIEDLVKLVNLIDYNLDFPKWTPAKGGKAKRKQIFAQSKKNLNAPKDASNG